MSQWKRRTSKWSNHITQTATSQPVTLDALGQLFVHNKGESGNSGAQENGWNVPCSPSDSSRVAVILNKSRSWSMRDSWATPARGTFHFRKGVIQSEDRGFIHSKHSHHVLIHSLTSFLGWVQFRKHNTLWSPASLMKKLSSNFSTLLNVGKALNCWEVPSETTHSESLAFLSSAWHMSQSRGSQREKNILGSESTLCPRELQKEKEMKAKSRGQAAQHMFLSAWPPDGLTR